MSEQYQCHSCFTKYDVTENVWKCKCGGVLDLVKGKIEFECTRLKKNQPTMWRYIDVLPFNVDSTTWQSISMGEGFTPLIKLDDNDPNIFVKS
jgi:threonine synthase